jgi:hypothetical protein
MVELSHDVDTNWYTDIEAIKQIITVELDKPAVKDRYTGQERVHTANGLGMSISYTGHSTLHTPYHHILLNRVLHVTRKKKRHIYVHKLTSNQVYLEYHPHYFLVKDQTSKKVLLQGRCKNGLYPWPSLDQSLSSKCAFMTTKPSSIRMHDRLGHPSVSVISILVSGGKLVCAQESNKSHLVCDACQ